MATHESVPAPLQPAGTCPSLQGGGEPVWALFVPPPRFRCRVHAVEISASGHGWLSLAVKIKRQCRRSTSGGVQGDAGLPPAMGLRNRSVVRARDIVGGRFGHVVGGAVQERVQGARAASSTRFCWGALLALTFQIFKPLQTRNRQCLYKYNIYLYMHVLCGRCLCCIENDIIIFH